MDLTIADEIFGGGDSNDGRSADLLFCNFNQDYGCFSIGTENGIRIYNSDPFKEKMRREFETGGIGHVTMLYRSNFLALVGGGRNPQFPPNKVMLWDDSTRQVISELEFRSDVRKVMLRRDLIVVLLRSKAIVCSLEPQPQKLHAFETYDNFRGIGALSCESENGILIFPGRQKGHIQVVELNSYANLANNIIKSESKNGDSASETASLRNQLELTEEVLRPANINIIVAHNTALSALAISADGTKIASASEKGTLIRVFSASGGVLLYELRRGVDRASIYSLAFSSDAKRLVVSSDKGTIHVFNLDYQLNEDVPTFSSLDNKSMQSSRGNRQSSLSFFKGILPRYFSSEWSFAHFRIQSETRCICGFDQSGESVIVVCANGIVEKYSIGFAKGQCTREWSRRFI